MAFPGEREVLVAEAVAPTEMLWLALALCPKLSVTITVMVCPPTSWFFGVQLKPPDWFIFPGVKLEVITESLAENAGFVNPDATVFQKTV
jgi:hypothetical protein